MPTNVTADTNRVSLFIAEEPADSWGQDAPVGALAYKGYEVRMTGETLAHQKQTVVSETIRTDRQRDTLSEVGAAAEGDINFELAFFDLDLLLEGIFANDSTFIYEKTDAAGAISANPTGNLMTSTTLTFFTEFVVGAEVWVGRGNTNNFPANAANNGRFKVIATGKDGENLPLSGNTVVTETPAGTVNFKTNKVQFTDIAVGSTTTITSTTTDFTTFNLVVGQKFRTAGFTNSGNNGIFTVAAIAANTLTTVESTLTVESATTVTFTGKRLKNGTARKSLLVEKFFGDIAQYVAFPGFRQGTTSLTVASQAIVTATSTNQGKEGLPSASSILGVTQAAGITPALNATTNVGQITENGVALTTALQGIALEIGNNLRTKPQVGSRSPVDIGYGFIDVTGTITAYFEDLALYNKFINHTQSSLSFRFTDGENNVMEFTIPRLFFSDGNPTTPGGNQDVTLPLEFTAVRDVTTDATIILDMIAA